MKKLGFVLALLALPSLAFGAAADARWPPRKNVAFRATFPIYDAEGDLRTGSTGLYSESSCDGATQADVTAEATEIATSTGTYYLDLTAGEMNCDTVSVVVKSTSSGSKDTVLVLYPNEVTDIRVNIEAISDDTTAPGNLELDYDGTGYNKSASTIGTATALGTGAVNATAVATGAIDADAIATDAIGAAEIAADAVGAAEAGFLTDSTGFQGADIAAILTDTGAYDTDAEHCAANWGCDATTQQTQGTFGGTIGDQAADADDIWALANAGGAGPWTTAAGFSTAADCSSPAEVAAELATYDGPTDAEMIARTLVAASYFDPAVDAVATVTTLTGHTAQTGDTFALANGANGFVAIEAQTDDIGAAGAGLSAIPWNSAWDVEVQSEVNDELVLQRLDELVAADSDLDGAAPPTVGSYFHEFMTTSAAGFTYDQTTDSNEAIADGGSGLTAADVWNYDIPSNYAPTGTSAGAVLDKLTEETATLSTDIALGSVFGQLLDDGSAWTYDRTADSLEVISAASAPSAARMPRERSWTLLVTGRRQQPWTSTLTSPPSRLGPSPRRPQQRPARPRRPARTSRRTMTRQVTRSAPQEWTRSGMKIS
jgi:hypothetical protein